MAGLSSIVFWAWPRVGAYSPAVTRGHAHEKCVNQFVKRLLLALANQLREELHYLPDNFLGRPPLFAV